MNNISKKVLETYKNIYLGPFLKEKFQETTTSTSTSSDKNTEEYKYDPIFTLVAYAVFFFAIYLSFRCNNGFSVWGFLGAFLFSPIYILYKLTSDYDKCRF